MEARKSDTEAGLKASCGYTFGNLTLTWKSISNVDLNYMLLSHLETLPWKYKKAVLFFHPGLFRLARAVE